MCEDTNHPMACDLCWLVDDIGHFMAGVDPAPWGRARASRPPAGSVEEPLADVAGTVRTLGQQALVQGARDVNILLRSAYQADDVVASELRLSGLHRGNRRTVFAEMPTPVALLLVCMRLCDPGDKVELLQHTAANGSTNRSATWPFGMTTAEEITRPPPPSKGVDRTRT